MEKSIEDHIEKDKKILLEKQKKELQEENEIRAYLYNCYHQIEDSFNVIEI